MAEEVEAAAREDLIIRSGNTRRSEDRTRRTKDAILRKGRAIVNKTEEERHFD